MASNRLLTSKTVKTVFLTALLCVICFMAVLPLGHDLHYHMYRIGAMADQFRLDGFKIPLRILSVSYNNYGYASPIFYGDTLLYIPAFLTYLGVNASLSLRLLLVVTFLAAFAVMYMEVRICLKDKEKALIYAVTYAFSPYFLTDLVIRMAVGEATAMVFLPVFFIALYRLIYDRKKYDWLHLSLGLTAILFCHNLTAILTVFIAVIYVIINIFGIKNIKLFLCDTLKSAVLFLLLSASFIFPMIDEMRYQSHQTYYSVMDHFDLWDLFFPYEIQKILAGIFNFKIDLESWQPGGLGLSILFISVLLFLAKRRGKRLEFAEKTLLTASFVSLILYILMYVPAFLDIMDGYIGFMQFIWRFCSFFSVFWSMLSAAVIIKLDSSKKIGRALFIAVFIGIYAIGTRYAYQIFINIAGESYLREVNSEFADKYIMEYSPNAGDNLYLPKEASITTYMDRGEKVLSSDGKEYTGFKREKSAIYLYTDPDRADVYELPLYMYKGYKAVDTSTNEELKVEKSNSGLVSVAVPKGHECIRISYAGTALQKISDVISLLTTALVFIVIIKKGREIFNAD